MNLIILKMSFLSMLLALAGSCSGDKAETKDPVSKEEIEDSEIVVEDFNSAEDAPEEVNVTEIPLKNEDAEEDPAVTPSESVPNSAASKASKAVQPVAPMQMVGTYYVSAKSADVKEQPMANSKTMRTLTKGDRVQVKSVDKEWANLTTGGYVALGSVTTKPVGPDRRSNQWHKAEPKK